MGYAVQKSSRKNAQSIAGGFCNGVEFSKPWLAGAYALRPRLSRVHAINAPLRLSQPASLGQNPIGLTGFDVLRT
jgi:hypothetical protein